MINKEQASIIPKNYHVLF